MPQENAPSNEMAIILSLVRLESARRLVARTFEILEILPGFTLGGWFCARFSAPGGDRVEIGRMHAIGAFEEKRGFLLEPVTGGRGKPSARWVSEEGSSTICVEGEGLTWIEMRVTPRIRRVPIRMGFPFILARETGFPSIIVYQTHQFELATSRVVVPRESPLRAYPHGLKIATLCWQSATVFSEDRLEMVRSERLAVPDPLCEATPRASVPFMRDEEGVR